MKIAQFILPGSVDIDLKATGKIDVLEELAALIGREYPQLDPGAIAAAFVERERLASTGIGDQCAFPHARSNQTSTMCGALGISRTGIPFDAVDGQPVHFFIALVAPADAASEHVRALGRSASLLRDPRVRERLLTARDNQTAYNILLEEDGKQ